MACAWLREALGEDPPLPPMLAGRVAPERWAAIASLARSGLASPLTSSAGRLFDAVAAIAGLRDRVSFEGQAAMELEWLGAGATLDRAYTFDLDQSHHPIVVDPRPMIREAVADVLAGTFKAAVARRFHAGLAEAITAVCRLLRSDTGIETVVLTGGVFLNGLLTGDCFMHLRRDRFRVYRHERLPPNDGGLSLGQLAVAAARLTTND
jgi:hydrogenase maturation protein HypF